MNQSQISEILSEHEKWIASTGGERANLRDADLSGAYLRCADLRCADLHGVDLRCADLRDADLRGANLRDADLRDAELWNTIGNRKEIKSIMVSKLYHINYTKDRLQIGCENHAITDWWEFTDREIIRMDGKKALNFWREWKDTIRMIIEKSPGI